MGKDILYMFNEEEKHAETIPIIRNVCNLYIVLVIDVAIIDRMQTLVMATVSHL